MPTRVVPIRIGFASPEPVAEPQRTYYRQLSTVFFGSSASASDLEAKRTLPVVSERLTPLESIARIILDEIEGEALQYVLLDLGGPDETDILQLNLIAGAVEAAEILITDSQIVVGILLPVPIDARDVATAILQRAGADERIRILSADGETWGAYFDRVPVPAELASWAEAARTSPAAKLESRLIRRVGQYRLVPNGPLLRHFYDGHLAVDEIYGLLTDWLGARGFPPGTRIVYDTRFSTWFRAPLEAALRHAELWDDARPFDDHEAADADAFVLPIIRTGDTLARLLGRRSSKAAAPDIWSLLSTQGDGAAGERPINFQRASSGLETVFVSYALRVEIGEIPDQAFWEGSGLGAIDPNEENLASPFSSDSIWGMTFEAGLVTEKTVPTRRPPVGYVPDFGEIAKRNGPFIAAKVHARLRERFLGSLPPSIGFLCPAELHAEILADSLRSLAGHDTIAAERELIDKFAANPSLSHEAIRLLDPKTFEALQGWRNLVLRVSSPERPKIVLLDEFDVTGGTFGGLFRLARAFDLPVLCTISLASYHHVDVTPSVPHLTLYEMGRPW
jgi:hypothetical protein